MNFKEFLENWFNDFEFRKMNSFELMNHFKLNPDHGWTPEWVKYWLSYPDENNKAPGKVSYENKSRINQNIIVQNPHDEKDTYLLISNPRWHMTNLNRDKLGYYFVRDYGFNTTKNANFDLINISFPNQMEALKFAIDNHYIVQQ